MQLQLDDVARLKLAVLTSGDVELDFSALVQGLIAFALNLGIVDEEVIPVLEMNPYPFSALNHLTFPLAISSLSSFFRSHNRC